MARTRKRQARLDFNPIASSDHASAQYHQQIRDRAAHMGYHDLPTSAKRRKPNNGSPGRLVPVLPRSPEKSMLPSRSVDPPSEGDEQITNGSPSRSVVQSAQKKARTQRPVTLGSSPGSLFNKPMSLRSSQGAQSTTSRKRKRLQKTPVVDIDSDSSPGPDPSVTPASKSERGARTRPVEVPSDVEEDDDDDDDDELPVLTSARRTQAPVVNIDDSDDEVPVKPRLKQRRQRSYDHEVDADARDLQNNSEPEEVTGPRSAQKVKRDARQELLERLKRRRAGVSESPEASEESGGSEESEDDLERPAGVRYTSTQQLYEINEEDEEFLTDQEDEGQHGSTSTNLPLMFSRYASMKGRDLFKYAVDWMVQKKINPAFRADDEIYSLAFQKLDDEVKQLAGSKFMSSAWTPDFFWALRARPHIASARIDRHSDEHYLRDRCDACNRSGHPATWQVQFVGIPYQPQSLEPVSQHSQDSDEDDSSSSDGSDDEDPASPTSKAASRPARDHAGRTIVPATTIFYVGKFCYRNCEQAHALEHWRYHLFEWVCEYLESEGHLSPDKIVTRDKWHERKRRRYVNKLVDEMDNSGKIKELWREFRQQIDQARDAKQERW